MAHRPKLLAILIDLSGTLHIGDRPTPNAVAALQQLQELGIPYRLCSNTSKESTRALCARLRKIGFFLPEQDSIWTSIRALKSKVDQLALKRSYCLLSPSAQEEIGDTALDIRSSSSYDSVLVGLAPSLFTYDNLNMAFRILTHEHQPTASSDPTPIPLIVTHKAKYIESSNPRGLSLGPGPFVTALEEAAGVKAQIVGKPTKEFFLAVIDDLHLPLPFLNSSDGKIAIVGDDVEADLGEGAVELGLWRVLVRTGKYRPGDESKKDIVPPDEVVDSFSSFIQSLRASS